jgi:hypothetical protein
MNFWSNQYRTEKKIQSLSSRNIVTADTSPQHLELFDQLKIHVLYKPIDIQKIEQFIASSLEW